jgi:hypothetical protein
MAIQTVGTAISTVFNATEPKATRRTLLSTPRAPEELSEEREAFLGFLIYLS